MKNESELKLKIHSKLVGDWEQIIPALPCVIGRGATCGVSIDDPSMSHRHAMLTESDTGELLIRDLDSTNGVLVNNKPAKEQILNLPAKVILGYVVINISAVNSEREPATTSKAETTAPSSREVTDYSGQKAAEHKRKEPSPSRSKRKEIICPHCWHKFSLEDFLFITRHHDLIGDTVLGPDAQQRFLPSKFTPEGHAVDSAGLICPDMACPRCHLRIPRSAAEMPPLFVSIVGAPASGKSYFLTAMMWELRNTLAQKFAMSFTDTDAVSNQILNDFEEDLFLNSDPDQMTALRKTELQGDLYNSVLLDGMPVNLLKPFMFSVTPTEHHPDYENARQRIFQTLVLYDNAGEHFEPGMDSVDNPTTHHLVVSDTIFFLFDPTKDARFRKRCYGQNDPQLGKDSRVQRQEVILTEMKNRIDKYTGRKGSRKLQKNMVVVIPKCDIWLDLLGYDIPESPWSWDPERRTYALDIDCIMSTSFSVRCLLEEICPELVSGTDACSDDLVFLPNSALGCSPEIDENTGMLGVRPRDINPFWIQVPMLYLFYRHGLIPVLSTEKLPHRDLTEVETTSAGDVVFVDIPGESIPLQVPKSYIGYRLRSPRTGQWFKI